MMDNTIITLSTDFGCRDPFAGIMKGVILGINPLAEIVDITHNIENYNIMEAAIAIGMSYRYFPQNTIHVVITDPGVGSARRPILVSTPGYFFVGPDNGVFSFIYSKAKQYNVLHLTEKNYFLPDSSSTFHGRDIFAPVAAWLSKGINPENLGTYITDYTRLSMPPVSRSSNMSVEGVVLYLDHFGNAITNITTEDLNTLKNYRGSFKIVIKEQHIDIKEYYGQADDKGLYAIINSMNHLEIFVRCGDAAKNFGIKIGDPLRVMLQA